MHEHTAWWSIASAVLLLALMAWFAFDDLRRRLGEFFAKPQDEADGASVEVPVEGMTCNNCVANLERALRRTEGVTGVDVELESGRAVVRGEVDRVTVERAVADAGFTVPGAA